MSTSGETESCGTQSLSGESNGNMQMKFALSKQEQISVARPPVAHSVGDLAVLSVAHQRKGGVLKTIPKRTGGSLLGLSHLLVARHALIGSSLAAL